MPDYTITQLTVSTLTPLHIGNGVTLLHEYDYAIHQGRTWRINESALLDAQNVDEPTLADRLARTPPARLLNPSDYKPESNLFRYVIKGTPRSEAEGAQVQEQIKDPFDRLFLPGSSLKGALRTSIGWYAWNQMKLKPDPGKLNRSRKWAGQRYEQEIFGNDPYHDMLRALQITDSQPLDAERLMILNVRVLNRGGGLASPIELEALHPDSIFNLQMKIDKALFSDWAHKHKLHLGGGEWLEDLVNIAKAHSNQRIQDEIRWYKNIRTASRLLGFYQQLDKLQGRLSDNQFFLQLGWGTGWDDKTFGSHLRESHFLENIIKEYRMTRGKRMLGDPFPKSRRVAVSITSSSQGAIIETPAYPLGWVLVEMNPT